MLSGESDWYSRHIRETRCKHFIRHRHRLDIHSTCTGKNSIITQVECCWTLQLQQRKKAFFSIWLLTSTDVHGENYFFSKMVNTNVIWICSNMQWKLHKTKENRQWHKAKMEKYQSNSQTKNVWSHWARNKQWLLLQSKFFLLFFQNVREHTMHGFKMECSMHLFISLEIGLTGTLWENQKGVHKKKTIRHEPYGTLKRSPV